MRVSCLATAQGFAGDGKIALPGHPFPSASPPALGTRPAPQLPLRPRVTPAGDGWPGQQLVPASAPRSPRRPMGEDGNIPVRLCFHLPGASRSALARLVHPRGGRPAGRAHALGCASPDGSVSPCPSWHRTARPARSQELRMDARPVARPFCLPDACPPGCPAHAVAEMRQCRPVTHPRTARGITACAARPAAPALPLSARCAVGGSC